LLKAMALIRSVAVLFRRQEIDAAFNGVSLHRPGLAQNAWQWDNREMQRFLTTALLLAAAMMLAGDGYAQQTPPASAPSATTPAAPAATTPKAPVKKTAPAAKSGAGSAQDENRKVQLRAGDEHRDKPWGNLKKQSVEVDWNLVAQGLKDAMSGGKTRLTEDEAKAVLTEVQNEVQKQQQEKMAKAGAKNKTEGEAFLAANKGKEGVSHCPMACSTRF
jgi:hypothetical protein